MSIAFQSSYNLSLFTFKFSFDHFLARTCIWRLVGAAQKYLNNFRYDQ